MRKTLQTLGLALAVVFAAGLWSTASGQQKYAVLISAGRTTLDDQMYHSEFWYDTFQMYRMLIERGFTHANIFVLYGNGADLASSHPEYQTATVYPGVAQITDFPNSKADINTFFTRLANGDAAHGVPQIQAGDFLFFWWMGHGSWDGDSPAGNHLYHASIQNTGESVTDAEFQTLFQMLPACMVKTVFVMTCHSGGLLDDIGGLHMMAHTSSRYDQSSYSSDFDRVHADFSYHAASGLRELTPAGTAVASDTDGDARLTIREANDWVHSHTASSETVVGDYRSIAPRIALEDGLPASSVPVSGLYSRDFAEDDGTVPSDYQHHVWYEGPDLWVRWNPDGGIEHQDPEFGQTNHVYARVHNVGCESLNANVDIFWSETTTWASPASWHPVGSMAAGGLAAGETRVLTAPWTSVPIPGKYCLHTTVSAPGDSPNTDSRAYMDDNKVQLNVTVEEAIPGWAKVFPWVIENARREASVVDLILSVPEWRSIAKPGGVEPRLGGTAIRVLLPPRLKFQSVQGAVPKRTREGTVLEFQAGGRQVVVQGVTLEPLEHQDARLSVTLPTRAAMGTSVAVKVSQKLEGQEVGGVIFRTRAASLQQVFDRSILRLGNLLGALSRESPSQKIEKVVDLCHKNRKLNPSNKTALISFLHQIIQADSSVRSRLKHLKGGKTLLEAQERFVKASRRGDPARFVETQEALSLAAIPHFRGRLQGK